ncbi:ribonuclease P protein component [Maribacter sp. 2210JD10-5]|uniref:ribonuclease P protein component n=1 Tax=Maribacter sp. 2210JD10-5 TaxID=3386272 RepID=UPI0039BC6EFD
MTVFSYPKREKLKSKKAIQALFSEGKSVSVFPLKLIYLKTQLPENVSVQCGVAVPKKNFKNAVKRNRIKRLMREAYRLNKALVFNNTEAKFAFLILYLGKDMPSFQGLAPKMKLLLDKFNTLPHE